jgi:hypothetical protein
VFGVGALAGSLLFLFRDPREPVDIESHWRRVGEPAAAACPMPEGSAADWTVRLPRGDGGFAGFGDAVAVADACDGECPVRVEADIQPHWGDRPGFFTGFATARIHIALNWRRPECEGRSSWLLDVVVDQGRRGRESVVSYHVGRIVADFLTSGPWSMPVL